MSDLILVQESSTPETVELVSAGPQGPSGTFTIGTITTGLAGSSANVTNTGTPSQAVLNFTIPRGDVGDVTPEATAAKNAAQSAASAAAASQVVASDAATSATASASSAQQSATAAASSASTATSKAAEASTSAASAASSESVALGASSTATLKASEAGSFATAASTSAASSETSANASASYAATASGSANASATSAGNASGSASLAQEWATKTISEVAVGQGYGAKKYALDAASMAAAAEIAAAGSLVHSQTAAGHSQSASTSADNANTSASVSSDASVLATLRAGQAAESASTASSQAANAAASAATATSQASSATASASTASTQAGIATTKASEAATSASAASVSAAAALASQTASAGSAAAANTSAGAASGSAASALAIYGTTAAQQAALTNAQSAASLAQGYALSASSAIQQDLSGVTAQALHRSPNAVTAMFVYDTSKDSDGGAWTERCQHTSWYNEALNGKWLGAYASEFEARNVGATLGTELVTNGSFSSGSTGWTLNTGWSVANGLATKASGTTDFARFTFAAPLTGGKTYIVQFDVVGNATAGTISARFGGGTTVSGIAVSGNGTFRTALLAASGNERIEFVPTSTFAGSIDNISVREVTALTTTSNDYFQLTTDGKFYKFSKNLFSYSELLTAGWTANNNASISGAKTFAFAANNSRLYQGQSIAAGTTFTVSATFAASDAGKKIRAAYYTASGWGLSSDLTIPANGFVSATITPSETVTLVGFQSSSDWTATVTFTVATGVQLEVGATATSYEAKQAGTTTTETFRGNKRKFPKLAGIVAEAASVTIYDLTEPGRPMWMRFRGAYNSGFFQSSDTFSTLSANNGVLSVGCNNTYGCIALINFASEVAKRYRYNIQPYFGSFNGYWRSTIANRNTGLFWGGESLSIVNDTVNAVAMTVLPDAPVDPVTGLKVPTIAVATAGGVSVIKHNGTVVNSSTNSSHLSVAIDNYSLSATNSGGATAWAYNPGSLAASFAMSSGLPSNFYANQSNKHSAFKRSVFATVNFLTRVNVSKNFDSAIAKSLVTTVAPTYNTGHLVGDIRRAYLADVDVGSVSGAELVTNGTFDADTTGWVPIQMASITNDTGTLKVIYGGGIYGGASSAVPLKIGSSYRLTFDVVSNTGSANLFGFISSGIEGSVNRSLFFDCSDIPGTKTATFTASTAASYVTISAGGGGFDSGEFFTIDNVSIKELVADRSYKGTLIPITGTLTKSQVASAAQLVAYSGFSASNYLREPYSADLDFAQGEWSVGAWVNVPAVLPVGNFPVIGAETVNTSTGSWTYSTGITASGNVFTFTNVNGDNQNARTSPAQAAANKHYLLTLTVAGKTGTGGIRLNFNQALQFATSVDGVFTKNVYFNAGGEFKLYTDSTASGLNATVTVSIREVSDSLLADRSHSSGSSIKLGVSAAGFLTATAFDGTTTRTVTTIAAYNTGTWLKAEAQYKTDGSLGIVVNGQEVAVTRGNPLLTLNNSNAVLTIGNSYAGDAPFPGSIALLKFSATVPTAEQSVWMYEQEKQMFRDGAQVTLPDAGSIVDLTYDDATDKWIAVSATNESEWSGLVRTSVTPSPAGSYTKVSAASGVQLQARSTTNPGVDVTIPSYGLREELVNRSLAAARLARNMVAFDYVGGFTANTTTGSTAIASVASLTYPVSYVGARISGAGIPANTTVVAVSGTTIYMSAAATATASTVQISFVDFNLPVGYEAKNVLYAGATKVEGATKDFTRLFDGFKETIRFGTAPGFNVAVQIQATRSVQ